jgi:hypothetical protein
VEISIWRNVFVKKPVDADESWRMSDNFSVRRRLDLQFLGQWASAAAPSCDGVNQKATFKSLRSLNEESPKKWMPCSSSHDQHLW